MLQNRNAWDLKTKGNLGSDFYDVASFKEGRNALRALEQEELGDVRGRSLLHLQCHFGLDTLSWARLGARATGVDFSQEAVALADSLAAELGLDVRFVCANVYDLPDVLEGEFDIVFTSYGVLHWLPDLDGWARVVARFLRPGGTFCLVDFHPLLRLFEDVDGKLELTGSLFDRGPFETEVSATYGDRLPLPPHSEHHWYWTIGEVVTSLSRAGLRIERLREVPELPFDHPKRFPGMVPQDDGHWRLPGDPIPLMFSCVATLPM
jgi:SAM-dependent methyltransferase